MAEVAFGGREDAGFPLYFNPNIFFTADPSDTSTPAFPVRDVPIFIFASVTNNGTQATNGATVNFFICAPSTVPSPPTPTPFSVSNVSLAPGESKEVLCVQPWVPEWVNDGHVCVVCEVADLYDPAPAHPPDRWDINDRHVAQHNVDIKFVATRKVGVLSSLATLTWPGQTNGEVTIRRAPKDVFRPALARFGFKRKDLGEETQAGLLGIFEPGDSLPKSSGDVPQTLKLKGTKSGVQRPIHAFLKLPDDNDESGAAVYLVEQHDDKGKLVGGVAVIVLGGKRPQLPAFQPAAPALPVTMPYRPYATDPDTGIMIPDGIFVSVLGQQHINVETRNEGGATLEGLSVYVEGLADPAITTPIRITAPLGGRALSQVSFKSVFAADFTRATPGATRVSFIVQQRSGNTITSVRILKKIFIVGVGFDKATKTFEINVPEGTLHYHANIVIAPKGFDKNGGKDGCKCGPDDKEKEVKPIPIFPKSGTLLWVPRTPYAGTHGPLPFDDPLNKVPLAVASAIITLITAIAWLVWLIDYLSNDDDDNPTPGGGQVPAPSGGSVEGSVGGTFDETSGEITCCTGVQVVTDNKTLGALTTLTIGAWVFTVMQDGKDLHEYGRDNTTPDDGERTVGELVEFDIVPTTEATPGVPWGTDVKWSYTRSLDSGRTLTYATTTHSQNMHYLKSYTVSINGTVSPTKHYIHSSKRALVIGAQFTKPDGSLFRGAELYVYAWLFSNRGEKMSVELRDDGFGEAAGFDASGNLLSASESGEILSKIAPAGIKLASHTTKTTPNWERGILPLPLPPISPTTTTEFNTQANTGTYVAAVTALEKYRGQGPTSWYVFVQAQDVNTVPEGTEAREAAMTVGGVLLTKGYRQGWNEEVCEWEWDAVVQTF